MKIKTILIAAGFTCGAALDGATLSVETAVQTQPDPASPVFTVLKAGSEQPAPSDKAGPPPPGWTAVDIPGPFEGYVKNRDLTKQLDVLPGASVLLAPKDGAGVLAVFEKGDKAEITGLHGSWTQVRLEKTLVGYIRTGAAQPSPAAVGPTVPVAAFVTDTDAAAPAPAPAAAAPSAAAPSAPAPGEGVALSRLFEGNLAPTQSLLMAHRPFDWQLVDASGKRIAYVDLSKLLLTDQIGAYSGRAVVVLGSIKPVKETNDLVIDVEGLRLK
jgi:hypothetical protein